MRWARVRSCRRAEARGRYRLQQEEPICFVRCAEVNSSCLLRNVRRYSVRKRGAFCPLWVRNGYPYGMPVNHWYCKENGKIYFHGAKEGHKVDAIRQNGKVSFCVYDQGYREEGQWALNIRSVIVFGTIRPVTEEEVCKKVCQGLAEKFTDDSEYAKKEWEAAGSRVLCLELTPDHITGKLVNES